MTTATLTCMCRQWPACQEHAHEPDTGGCTFHGHITLGFSLPGGAEGPPCIWCNAPTKRTGACFTCVMCGSTTSC